MKVKLNISREVDDLLSAWNIVDVVKLFGFNVDEYDIVEIKCDICKTDLVSATGKFDSIMWCPKCHPEL